MYRILTVDDEHMIHLSLKKLLSICTKDFEIIGEAEDGKEALQLIEQLAPDVVITDIYMPVMDGLELIEQGKRAHPHVVFVILSGYDDFRFAQQAIRFGVSDFILKPLEQKQLMETLGSIYRTLQQKNQQFVSMNAWLDTFNSLQAELIEQLWALNEAAVSQVMDSLTAHFRQLPASEITVHQLRQKLLRSVETALQQKGLPMERIAAKPIADNLISKDGSCYDHDLHRQMKSWLEMIKQSRNLGSRLYMMKALDYIHQHFRKECLSLKEVAEVVGISKAYFSRSFKSEMNTTFIAYLVQIRLEEAKRLLEESGKTTMEIAFEVGFRDYPHFSKSFKKQYGISPSDYRKQRQRIE